MPVRRLSAFALLITALTAGCSPGAAGTTPTTSGASSPATTTNRTLPTGDVTVTLLRSGQLVTSSPGDDRLVGRVRLTRSRLGDAGFPLLALDTARGRLYALAPPAHGRGTVVLLDPRGREVTGRWELPEGVRYRAIAVGPRTGRVYLFGNRAHGRAETGPGEDALVTVLSPGTGEVLRSRTARRAAGRDWRVYAAAVSPDERRLLLSYHGSDTTGIDVVRVDGLRRLACRAGAPRPDGTACLATHGDFVVHDGQVLATTGLPDRLLRLTLDGRVRHTYRTRLPGNHLMEFAADLRHHRIWPIGPCGYAGGVSAINLSTGHTHVLVPPRSGSAAGPRSPEPGDVCGFRAQHLPGEDLVAVLANPVAGPDAPDETNASLTYVDVRTGHVRKRVILPAPAADLLVLVPDAHDPGATRPPSTRRAGPGLPRS